VGTVNIGISHNDDLVISQFGNIEIIMNTGAKGCDHSLDLFVCINLVQTGFLYVQDFSTKRKDSLCSTVTSCLRRATRGITLYDIDFAILRILVRAIGKLAWKGHTVKGRLPSGKISGLTRCLSGSLGKYRLLYGCLGYSRILFQKNLQLFAYNTVYSASGLTVSKFLLRLAFKLRIANFNADNGRQAFSDIITGKVWLAVLEKLILSGVIVKCVCNGISETSNMGTTFRSINIVYKSVSILCIRIIVLHGNFNSHTVLLTLAINDLRIKSFFTSVQISHKFTDTTFIVESFLPFHTFPLISKNDFQTFGKKSHFTETLFQDIVIVYSLLKNLLIRKKSNSSSGRITTFSNFLKRIHCLTTLVTLLISLSISAD